MNPVTAAIGRKVILPLGTLLGAGGMVMALGIPWTSSGEGAGGIRLSADDEHGATLTITHIKPGESETRSVTIRNSGGTSSRLSFQETGEPSTFADGELHLAIEKDGKPVYDGPFAGMSDFAQDMGNLAPGGSSTFLFTVSLPDDAPFANQGTPATASYAWETAPGYTASDGS
ncbi:hypothetical protein H5V45_05950 [Nocardioides sp. KIGAM211]|uniref:Uncharacterized protein n=1 Tax=Nocardioides luti TaxID=2761101 RepID=A0A7X0REK0_9ACTN|nr:hypothetical protein [Nocardioides luti]MBB6626859.1 hypothetical protein [Nocardioides luti]